MADFNQTEGKPKSKFTTFRIVLIVMGVSALFRIVGREADRASTERGYANAVAQVTNEGANEGLIHAKAAAMVLESHYKQHSNFPDSLAAVDFDRPLPETVQSIRVEADGTLRVVLMGGGRQDLRSFRLRPQIDAAGKFTWACVYEEMPAGTLPAECSRRTNDG